MSILFGATLYRSDMQGAILANANFSSADLTLVENLNQTSGLPVYYDAFTDFTGSNFDPAAAAWTFIPEPNMVWMLGAGVLAIAASSPGGPRSARHQ